MVLAIDEGAPGVEAPAGPRPLRFAEPPRWLVVVVMSIATVAVAGTFASGWFTGISWDEPIHVERLRNWFDHGWYLPDDYMAGSEPSESANGEFVYAPVTALLGHAVAVVAGSETWGKPEETVAAYQHRHVMLGLLGVVGLMAAGGTVRLLTNSRRWGLVGASVLASIPLWAGHASFNIKDVGVAVGYGIFTFGLMLVTRVENVRQRRQVVTVLAVLTSGLVLALGTRPGVVAALGVSGAIALGYDAWLSARSRTAHWRSWWVRAGCISASAALAAVVLWLLYPKVLGNPLHYLAAIDQSSDFGWNGRILTAGQLMSMPPPWTYLPYWFSAQIPMLVTVGLAWAVCGGVLLVARRGMTPEHVPRTFRVGVLLLVVQATLLPTAAVLRGSVIYDGVRQFLFVIPALAVLATLGWALAATLLRAWRPRLVGLLWSVMVLGLLVPVGTSLLLFPYGYTWVNGATALQPVDGRWMVDYWRLSDRELTTMLPASGTESCALWAPMRQLVPCASIPQHQPYWPTRGTGDALPLPAPGEYAYVAPNRIRWTPPPECHDTRTISRRLFLQQVTIGYAALCPTPLVPMPASAVDTSDPEAAPYLLWGWELAEGAQARNAGAEPTIGFTVNGKQSEAASLVLLGSSTDGHDGVVFRVNGRNVPTKATVGGWRVRLPVVAGGDGRVVVTLFLASDAPRSLVLDSMYLSSSR